MDSSSKPQPEVTVTIEFGKSSSKNYREVTKLCKRFDTFEPISEYRTTNLLTLRLAELRADSEWIRKILNLVRSWKSTQVRVNGDLVRDLQYDNRIRAVKCCAEYQESWDKENFCKISDQANESKRLGWGCKWLTKTNKYVPNMEWELQWRRRKFWFQYGGFEDEHIFRIDKQWLRHDLMSEVKKEGLEFCGVFNPEFIDQELDKLPDNLDLNDSDEWEVVNENVWVETDDWKDWGYESRPKGIRPKLKSAGMITRHGPGGLSIGISLEDVYDSVDPTEVQQHESKNRNIPDISWDQVGGIAEVVKDVREVLELPLRHPELFQRLRVQPHKGVLLYGPPGCGKTLIAKAIATEVKAHFISIAGPEVLSKYFGESEANLRNIFDEARAHNPTIIFFDEIDSIASTRSDTTAGELRSDIVNQLLTLMDGVTEYEGVRVVASTNRKDLLDEAILRPGRFDYSIEVKKPDVQGCRQIFRIHTRDMPLTGGFEVEDFASKLEGLSGSEIAFVAREGAYNCMRRTVDIEEAIQSDDMRLDLESLQVTEMDFSRALERLKKLDSES